MGTQRHHSYRGLVCLAVLLNFALVLGGTGFKKNMPFCETFVKSLHTPSQEENAKLECPEGKDQAVCIATREKLEENIGSVLAAARNGCIESSTGTIMQECPVETICKYYLGSTKTKHRITPLPAPVDSPVAQLGDHAEKEPAMKLAEAVLLGSAECMEKSSMEKFEGGEPSLSKEVRGVSGFVKGYNELRMRIKCKIDGEYMKLQDILAKTDWSKVWLTDWGHILYNIRHLPSQYRPGTRGWRMRIRSDAVWEQLGGDKIDKRIVPEGTTLKCPGSDGEEYQMESRVWLPSVKFYTVLGYRYMNLTLFNKLADVLAYFKEINQVSAHPQRMRSDILFPEVVTHIVALASALNQIMAAEAKHCGGVQQREAWREVGGLGEMKWAQNAYKAHQLGSYATWNSFLSTTLERDRYVHTDNEYVRGYWHIDGGKCADITKHSAFLGEKSESECLFLPFRKWQVVGTTQRRGGLSVIEAHYVA